MDAAAVDAQKTHPVAPSKRRPVPTGTAAPNVATPHRRCVPQPQASPVPQSVPAGELSLAEATDRFLSYLETYRRSAPATVHAYAGDLRRLAEFLERSHLPGSVRQITSRHLQGFAVSLSGLAPASVNRVVNCLGSFFAFLERQGRVETNPVRSIERPRLPEKLPTGPSVAQCQRLLEAARTPRERAVLMVLGCCGLRRGELLKLDVGDIAADLSELRIRQSKGQKDRVVPVPTQCQQVLREYLMAENRTSGPLFATGRGTALGVTSFYRVFRRLLKRAALQDAGITPHGLRHLFATSLLRGRADIETVRSLLGHRDIRTTSRYLHADGQARREAVERLPQLMVSAGAGSEPSGREVA